MQIDTFTGGAFETNCFWLPAPAKPGEGILIDAPEGAADWLARAGLRVSTLLITHGHLDHMMDAAKIRAAHRCRVGYHRDGVEMMTTPDFFVKVGFPWRIEPVAADFLIEETGGAGNGANANGAVGSETNASGELLHVDGMDFRVLLVPGHCPGSLCFFEPQTRTLFGGDVLFAGGVGRWDLPGGDRGLLLSGILSKVLPLGDDVTVLPGHGPATTVGRERATNAFLAGQV